VLLIDGMFDHGIDLDCAEGLTDLQCFRQGEHDVLMIPQDGLRFDPGESQVGGDRFGDEQITPAKAAGSLKS
jgi:hypothetical protein